MNEPPISLATERKARERDFSAERADLLAELREIGVEESELAAFVQRIMEIEWAVFHCSRMLEYHDLDQDARSVVELTKLMVRGK